MFPKYVFLFLFIHLCSSKTLDITFKNVTIRGYNMFVEKFKKTVISANNLQDVLPKIVIDKIEVLNQNVPVLYKNSLADLENLNELAITYSEVYEIRPGALKNVPLMMKLSLKGNKLEEIKEGVFNSLDLISIDVSNNAITTIESGAFNDMPQLLHIQLAENKLQAWNTEWFKNTPLLYKINMEYNNLQELPERAFTNLRGTKRFGNLDLTLNLIFSHNKIKTIHPSAFKGLDKLHNLWLDYNKLKDFDGNVLEGIGVKDLRLNRNEIQCLEGDFKKIFKADDTNIDGNPFDCECLNKIKDWFKNNNKTVDLFLADIECRSQRIRAKLDAVQERLNEIRGQYKSR